MTGTDHPPTDRRRRGDGPDDPASGGTDDGTDGPGSRGSGNRIGSPGSGIGTWTGGPGGDSGNRAGAPGGGDPGGGEIGDAVENCPGGSEAAGGGGTADHHPSDATDPDHVDESGGKAAAESSDDHVDESGGKAADETGDHANESGDDHADESGDDHADESGDDHADESGDDHADETGDHANESGDDHADEFCDAGTGAAAGSDAGGSAGTGVAGPPLPDRVRVDSERPPSEAVLRAVAAATSVDLSESDQRLGDVVDTDALDALFGPTTPDSDGPGRVVFAFCGCRVTVESDGRVHVTPDDAA